MGHGNRIPWPCLVGTSDHKELVSDQLLDVERFDVVTDNLGVPFAEAAGAFEHHYATVRPRRTEVLAVTSGEQRTVPTAPDMRAVDDVVRQHGHASGAEERE